VLLDLISNRGAPKAACHRALRNVTQKNEELRQEALDAGALEEWL
jgi:hypothetical protein